MKLACREDLLPHGINQRCKQITRSADPPRQRGAVEIDAFASVDLRLPIQRLMIGVLRDQHMRQQTGASESAIDGPWGCRRLHDPLAGHAA